MAPPPRSVAALLALLVAGLAVESQAAPQGSAVAYPGQFPWHAGVFKADKDSTLLGSGALIAPQYVLTSVSTLGGAMGSNEVTVLVGSLSPTGNKLPLSDVIIHGAETDKTIEYDIALLVLAAPVLKTIQPVRMPARYYQGATYVDQTLSVTGWGYGEDARPAGKQYLSVSNVAVIRNRLCQLKQDPDVYFSWDKMCAVGTGPTPCKGDAGDPVVFLENDQTYTLVGIMSSDAQCSSERPSTIHRITEFLDWIDVTTDHAIPIHD